MVGLGGREKGRVRAASAMPRPAFSERMSSLRPSSEVQSCSISSIWRGETQVQGLLVETRRREARKEETEPFMGEAVAEALLAGNKVPFRDCGRREPSLRDGRPLL